MSTPTIDLNCDLGESPESVRDGTDAALLGVVSSANIACGGHAGDDFTMTETVRAAAARNVAIGAHPSYPDKKRFGRVEMKMKPDDLEKSVTDQIRALDQVALALGARLGHVKPHGALYHAAMTKPQIAESVARAVKAISSDLVLVGLAGAPGLDVWRKAGLRVVAEAFADRQYEPDGSLRPRKKKGALIENPVQAAEQAVRIALGRGVMIAVGSVVRVEAGTLCVHSDTPGALDIARAVRGALELAGVVVGPIGSR